MLYQIDALYRDDFRITGFSFGEGEKALCIVGAMRGNENQQLYCCSRLVSRLTALEAAGRLQPGYRILVIPCVNPYSKVYSAYGIQTYRYVNWETNDQIYTTDEVAALKAAYEAN